MLKSILWFLRQVPVLDAGFLLTSGLLMRNLWRRDNPNPIEDNEGKRQAGAVAITNQINGTLTAASIVLAAVGAVLAIGFPKNLMPAALSHLTWAAIEALFSVGIGVFTLGIIPSVVHRMDVTKRDSVQIACFLQLMFIIVSLIRFLFALLYLSGAFPLF
jgi:hypothetical protein